MSISMELPVFTSFPSGSRACLFLHSSKRVFYGGLAKFGVRLKYGSASKQVLRITMSSGRDCSSNGFDDSEVNGEDIWGDSDAVEVIGIGSRKDAVLDFCLGSPFKSSSMRFWSILTKDSTKVHLQQRILKQDLTPRILEAPVSMKFSPKALILVASAGYGLDHIAAVDILRTIKSANGFTIVIILKPFSFEGQRRQQEIKHLVEKVREHTNLFIDVGENISTANMAFFSLDGNLCYSELISNDIDTDKLLRKDLVTLDEAVKTANNAVLLAINAISVLISETHRKLIDVAPCNDVKEVQVSELINILESYKEAKVGFGAGYDAKTSILQSLYDCPFLGVGVKDFNGMVICVLANSSSVDRSKAFLRTFRQTTEYTGSILLSMIHEPNLEPDLILTTVLIVGDIRQQSSQKSSILLTLAQHFPFVFDLLRRPRPSLNDTQRNRLHESSSLSEERDPGVCHDGTNGTDISNLGEDNDKYPEDFLIVGSSNDYEFYDSRNYNQETEESEVGVSETSTKSSRFYDSVPEGTPAFQREPLMSWNLGPALEISEEWAKERAAETGTTPLLYNLSIHHLPVGVRPSEELKDNGNLSIMTQNLDPEAEDDAKEPVVNSSVSSWSALTDASFEAVKDFCNNTFTSFKGKDVDIPKKQGVLSVRAASMLEAERDSPKKWSPTVEMPYRGGFYRGRCEGGLPEGKGRLVLGDGSIYDGIWHYGKRSGLGTFYLSNGDVFQGTWREDVMHGKGWFYFHTGERWFANFWKGKANGEGRFYSKSGGVFFGHFQDGWRHGHFLCIGINGTRSLEIWKRGILVSSKQLDSDTDTN